MNIRMHPASTWQAARRNALRMLQVQMKKARAEHRHDHADALLFAGMDVEDILRQRAAYLIEESTEMRFAHWAPGALQ